MQGTVHIVNDKAEHMTKTDLHDSTILPVHPGLGFNWEYLCQFWQRMNRCTVSRQAEAVTILGIHLDISLPMLRMMVLWMEVAMMKRILVNTWATH